MTWFYNNDGTADGPHEDAAMIAHVQAGRVTQRTLIWREGLELWQEAMLLKAEWWQPAETPVPVKAPPEPAIAAAPGVKPSAPRRSPTPLAPTGGEAPKIKSGGFLKRLFGRNE